MKEKVFFEDPELDVVRFNLKDIYTGTSGTPTQEPDDTGTIVDCQVQACSGGEEEEEA